MDALLCLDASFAMHAPLDLASSPVASWDSDAWDAFGEHLRRRTGLCRLDTLGLQALNLIGAPLRGLSVEAHFCGEEESASVTLCPFEAESLGRRWKRTLLKGANLWSRVADDVVRLKERGLKSIIVIAGSNNELRSE